MLKHERRHFDRAKVNEVWEEYARTHDLTGMERMAVGIDPDSHEVFLGHSLHEIVERLKNEGRFRPLYYRWVNDPYFIRKRGRR
jgi:hypothetical protein